MNTVTHEFQLYATTSMKCACYDYNRNHQERNARAQNTDNKPYIHARELGKTSTINLNLMYYVLMYYYFLMYYYIYIIQYLNLVFLSELVGQTIPDVTRISLFIKTNRPDQSNTE